jgi:glycosyltransferase involved in cell wall biosynthesis
VSISSSRPLHVGINAQLVSFGQTYRNAGVSRFTYSLLDGLSRLDMDQRYTAFINGAEAADAAKTPLATTPRLRLSPARWSTGHPRQRIAWEQFALPAALRRERIDVFHSPVNVLPERVPCACVVTVHDLAFERYPQYFRPARRMYQHIFTRRSAHAATLVAADSESTKRDLVERFHVPEERVRVVYPAIDADFTPTADPEALAAFRARNSLPGRYLLFLGTLEPRKNLLTLVEAYAALRAELPDTPQLVLAGGKGWYYQAVIERIRALGVERHITLAGYIAREDQPLWYAGAELFVYPSVYEGFGLPVAEALACGVPTVTSNVSSMPEAGGPVAIQVAPDDTSSLAHAMRGILLDSSARERARVEGPRWTSRFSVARMAGAYADVYREAAELGRGRGAERGR